MGPSNLGSKGLDYVSEINSMRASSSNLSGRFSGKMKSYLSFAKEVIRALVEKLETSGDVPHLRSRNQELTEELKEANKREEKMRRKIDDLHSAIHELRKEVRALKDGHLFSENRLKNPRSVARKGKAVDSTGDTAESR